MIDRPAGSVSATRTCCASDGPLLRIVSVYLTFSPGAGLLGATVFSSERSATRVTGVVTEAVLLAGFGSEVVVVAVATLVRPVAVLAAGTFTTTVIEAFAPDGISPRTQS